MDQPSLSLSGPIPSVHPDPRDLLSRDTWRAAVFARDHNACVVCGAPAEDAHHLIERSLWPDGGYYLGNGISLCDQNGQGCHARAEYTLVSCDELRSLAGITSALLPDSLDLEDEFDKWGNVLTSDGAIHPGPLFFEDRVQKALRAAKKLQAVSSRVKYPRTPHLPWSLGATKDDTRLASTASFLGQEVVVTVKEDGECTTIGHTQSEVYTHARSLDTSPHPSRSRVRRLAAKIGWDLPLGWRLIGENLQAIHSIAYANLPGAFLAFAVVDEYNEFLSWDETIEWATLLGVPTVPVLYHGPYDEAAIKACWPGRDPYSDQQEGYVLRLASRFSYRDFSQSVAKFVRAGHVTSSSHWSHEQMRENGILFYE